MFLFWTEKGAGVNGVELCFKTGPFCEDRQRFHQCSWIATKRPRVVSINRQLRYETSMTELLERAVQSLRALPPETQDALARILQQLVGDHPSIVTLSAEEKASLQTSFAQAERGEFATESQIKAVWAKHGL
jgi:hypothetical protein